MESLKSALIVFNNLLDNTLTRNQEMKKALEFYADPKNMRNIQLWDQGKKAREVLG